MSSREIVQQPTATPTFNDVATIKMTSGQSQRIMPMKTNLREEQEDELEKMSREEEELEHFLKMAELLDALDSQSPTAMPDTPEVTTKTAYTLTKTAANTVGPDPELLAYTSKMFGLN